MTQSDATTVAITAPSVTVTKVLDGGPGDTAFELTLDVTGASPNTEYPVVLPAKVTVGEDGTTATEPQTDVLRTDENGSGSYTGVLKNGESYHVKLPYGAKYTVSEDPATEYLPSYLITGEGAVIATPEGKAEEGEKLTTGEEVVDESSNVMITFTNTSKLRAIEIWKQLFGRYENKSSQKFSFRLDVTGNMLESYLVTLPDGTSDNINLGIDGKASYNFTLTGSETKAVAEKLTVYLPIGATYQVTELVPDEYSGDYKPSFYIGPSGEIIQKTGEAEAGNPLSTAEETADEKDARRISVKFTNTGISADLGIEKAVSGDDADPNDSFEYIIHFTGLTPGERYDLDGFTYTEIPTGVTMFLPGKSFNVSVKTLANTSAVTSVSTDDSSITSFIHSTTAPAEGTKTVVVSTDDSAHEILAWYESGVVYWYSEADIVYINSDATSMFANCLSLETISGLEDVNTSYTKTLKGFFESCSSLKNISAIANWDVSGVTVLSDFLDRCSALSDISALAGWNVSNVENFGSLFYTCQSLSDISPLARWDVSSGNSFYYLFAGCSAITTLTGLENWDVTVGSNFSAMFMDCSSLTDIDALANWNMMWGSNLSFLFHGCSSLANIQALANWNVSNGMNFGSLFNGCYSLKNVDALSEWNV